MIKAFLRTVGIYCLILGLKFASVFSPKLCPKQEAGYSCRHRIYIVNGKTFKECN